MLIHPQFKFGLIEMIGFVVSAMKVMRAPFFTATIAPVLMGTALAWKLDGKFNIWLLLHALFAMLFLHAAANMLNDYFDHLSGADWLHVNPIRPFTGGSRAIQDGLVQPRTVLICGLSSLAIGILLGIWLASVVGITLLLIGVVGVFFAYFYTAPPIRFAHMGLGEVAVGLAFGVLPVVGAFYVQARRIDWQVVIASLPIALLIMAVLWINEMPDAPYDELAGKRNLVVRLGLKRASIGYCVIVSGAFFMLPFISRMLSTPLPLIGWLAFPAALIAMINAIRYAGDTSERIARVACGMTIMVHLATGILLTVAYAL